MIKEFALDPAVPAQSSKDCRYFLDALRIENGRLLSCFPGHWRRLAYDAAKALHNGKVELSRIEACLGKLSKESLFSGGRPGGNGSETWLQRAIVEHARVPFTAVIALEPRPGAHFVIGADDVESSSAFQATGQRQIARTSSEIMECVALLLRVARSVKLIDPYFDASKPRWRRGLQKLIELVPAGIVIEIHRHQDNERPDNQRRWFDGYVDRVLAKDVRVNVFLHSEPMHNRYILTDQGGASYGTGLDDNEDHDENHTDVDDVVLLSEESRKQKWNQCAGTSSPFMTFGPGR